MDISISQLAVTKYQNKKGEKKMQIVMSETLFQKLICGDQEILNVIKTKAEKEK